MKKRSDSTQRVGRIFRFSANGTDYSAFIWQSGVQFRGRVEGHANIPICTAKTAIGVRDSLQKLLNAETTA